MTLWGLKRSTALVVSFFFSRGKLTKLFSVSRVTPCASWIWLVLGNSMPDLMLKFLNFMIFEASLYPHHLLYGQTTVKCHPWIRQRGVTRRRFLFDLSPLPPVVVASLPDTFVGSSQVAEETNNQVLSSYKFHKQKTSFFNAIFKCSGRPLTRLQTKTIPGPLMYPHLKFSGMKHLFTTPFPTKKPQLQGGIRTFYRFWGDSNHFSV